MSYRFAALCVIAVLAASGAAVAQEDSALWIRSGTFPTRAAVLAPQVEVEGSIAVDVDRDGISDELLTLSRPDGDSGQALVLARHGAAGWTAICADCGAIGGTDDWVLATTVGTGVVAVRSHEGAGDGAENVHEVMYYWLAPHAEPLSVYDHDGSPPDELTAMPDGNVLIASDGRFRVLRWNAAHTELTPGPWLRTRPASNASITGCVGRPREAFHLRPTETLASVGPELPAGTALTVLARGTLERRASRMYRVQVQAGGATGFTFLAADELGAGCAPR